MKELSEIEPKSRSDFRKWLQKNQNQKESVWVVLYKKSSGLENLSAADVSEEALCFGWIDSVPNKVDADKYKLLVSPRKPSSGWSAVNKKRVAQLLNEGRMTPNGLRAIELAKANGAWSKLDSLVKLEMPPELKKGLDKNKKASLFYEAMAPSSKKAILEWILSAKTAPTRLKRIAETVDLAAQGVRANHFRDLKMLEDKRGQKEKGSANEPDSLKVAKNAGKSPQK